MKKVLFISSTGGHFNELMQLKSLFNKYDYYIVTEKDKTNENLKNIYKDKISYLPYATRSKIISYIFKYLYVNSPTFLPFPFSMDKALDSLTALTNSSNLSPSILLFIGSSLLLERLL